MKYFLLVFLLFSVNALFSQFPSELPQIKNKGQNIELVFSHSLNSLDEVYYLKNNIVYFDHTKNAFYALNENDNLTLGTVKLEDIKRIKFKKSDLNDYKNPFFNLFEKPLNDIINDTSLFAGIIKQGFTYKALIINANDKEATYKTENICDKKSEFKNGLKKEGYYLKQNDFERYIYSYTRNNNSKIFQFCMSPYITKEPRDSFPDVISYNSNKNEYKFLSYKSSNDNFSSKKIYRCKDYLLIIKSNDISVYDSENDFLFSYKINDKIVSKSYFFNNLITNDLYIRTFETGTPFKALIYRLKIDTNKKAINLILENELITNISTFIGKKENDLYFSKKINNKYCLFKSNFHYSADTLILNDSEMSISNKQAFEDPKEMIIDILKN